MKQTQHVFEKPPETVLEKHLGRHLLVEFYNCDRRVLDNVEMIDLYMNQAALASGATIVQSNFHRFEPWGVSGVVVIAESHLAIHTWPEYGYASVDLYTCGDSVDPMVAYEDLKIKLGAKAVEIQLLSRGDMRTIRGHLAQEAAEIQSIPQAQLKAVKGGVAR